MKTRLKELRSSLKPRFFDVFFLIILILGLRGTFIREQAHFALALWSLLYAGTIIFPSTAAQRITAAGLLLSEVLFQTEKLIPYLGGFPFDLFLIAVVGFLILRKSALIDFKSRWSFRLSRKEWLSVFAIAAPSVLVLTFYFYAHPEVAAQWPFPILSPLGMFGLVLVLAVINGLREELLYRFFFQNVFLAGLSPLWAILAQALAFGFLHYKHGFPQGALGIFLTSLFGIMMGIQYYVSRSMALAWLTHSLVDAIMFAIILGARPSSGF